MKYFSYIIIAIVAATVVAGFFIVGSPANERLRQADQQRIYNLQDIQNQIVTYWQSKETLPTDLASLTDNISGWRAPQDPKTGLAYTYEITGDLNFKLCASFDLEGESKDMYYGGGVYPERAVAIMPPSKTDNWYHTAGYYCFDRTIDPDLYPPLNKK